MKGPTDFPIQWGEKKQLPGGLWYMLGTPHGHPDYVAAPKEVLDAAKDTLYAAPKDQWVSVKDRLPEVGYFALVALHCDGEWDYDTAEYSKHGWELHSDDVPYATHWMNLPESPKEPK